MAKSKKPKAQPDAEEHDHQTDEATADRDAPELTETTRTGDENEPVAEAKAPAETAETAVSEDETLAAEKDLGDATPDTDGATTSETDDTTEGDIAENVGESASGGVEDDKASDEIAADQQEAPGADPEPEDADKVEDPAPIAVAGALPGAIVAAADTENKAEDANRVQPQAAAQQAARGPGFFQLFLGGVVAAGLGFLAGNSGALNDFLPERFQQQQVDSTPLQEAQSAQAGAVSALEEQIAGLSSAVEAAAGTSDAEGVEAVLETLSADIAGLAARVEALEARPVVEAAPDNIATTSDVDDLQAALDAQRAEIAALANRAREAEAQAAADAQAAEAQAALVRLVGAMDTGEAYSSALDELEQSAPVEVPEALRASAESGVASLAELQDSYPAAARAALAAARAEVPEAEVEGVVEFFQRQLNVRSIVPREGDDADAILSRAEALIRQNALGDALAELESLPEASQTAMQDWLALARARQAAQEAAVGLADSLTAN